MTENSHQESSNEYNTAIKDIAALKDYTLVFNIISAHFNEPNSTKSLIHDENEFDIRTIKSRTKVNWAINKTILQFINDDHRELIRSIFQSDIPPQDKKFAFFWHFCLNNRLFREVSVQVFAKIYFSGRAQISQEDIIGYIKDIIGYIKDISSKGDLSSPNWSEDTIYRLATKYLSLMTKFDFVSEGRTKSFNHIRPSAESLVLFLYFTKLYSSNQANILVNELLPTCFISAEDIQSRLKKLSMKGFFNMSFNGIALNIELTHSHKGICDALYSGS